MKKIIRLSLQASVLLMTCLTLQAQSERVGFVRIDYIVSQMPASKQVESQLNVQQTQAETELKRLQKEFDEKYASYQKTGAQLSESVRKDRETELQNLQTRIQEFSRSAQESLQKKYGQLMSPVLSKVQLAIDSVAKQNGYRFILNSPSNGSSNILYASEENNITDLVIKRLGITPVPSEPASATSTKSPLLPKSTVPTKKK
ncbi:OmpH family outer membrane protein [Spirosoma validum]|uniref:OmpH family outer membrane protein n=1 Tax=Spirosoma validum TaxID=2771355 RepID=A0A927B8P7_9BACT|nr:OmpH family outer membrane protein [Spirosoma validum]MBD2757409.1 OmpH family outer membrane protein [Spirosoma validum]